MTLPYPVEEFEPGLLITAADHMNPIRSDLIEAYRRLGSGSATGKPLADRIGTLETTSGNATTGNAALASRLTTVETRTTDETAGNAALDDRLTTLESTPPGSAISWGQVVDMDPTAVGVRPTEPTQVYQAQGGPAYIEFPNPNAPVSIIAQVHAGVYAASTSLGTYASGFVRPEISTDSGATWQVASSNPWCGVSRRSGRDTLAERRAVSSTAHGVAGSPTGTICVRCVMVTDATKPLNSVIGYYRVKLAVTVLGGNVGTIHDTFSTEPPFSNDLA